ncbi:MAG: sulfatase-like hydrolase/transferase [Elusimicrobiota bacterium]
MKTNKVFKVTTGIIALFTLKTSIPAAETIQSEAVKSKRPNIIVIMSDEHNQKISGCYGNQIVKTPNIDKLSNQGVTFTNCYTNSPLCVPSRNSFLAGQYVSRCSVWNNRCWLPTEDYPTVSKVLNDSGYETILCGKMHLDGTRRHSMTEIGGNMNKVFMTGKGVRSTIDITKPIPGISNRFTQIASSDTSSVLKHDRNVTSATIEFLKNRKPQEDKPLFMIVGYLAPHFPLIVPEKYWLNYKDKVPSPKLPKNYVEKLPLNYQHLRYNFNYEEVPEEYVKKAREYYYALTEWVDEEIGKVLDTIKETGYEDNTIIIYTTDHSENMGEHGLWWKNNMYDSATKIPLIIKYPDQWQKGQRRDNVCSLVDVTKTIVDLSGVTTENNWDGDSLVPLMSDPKSEWKDIAISEYYAHLIASGMTMIRQGKYKLIIHTPTAENGKTVYELFDLEKDPEEYTNLAGDKKYKDIITKMYDALVKEVGEKPELTELRCIQEFTKGYGRVKAKTAKPVKETKDSDD